MAQECNTLQPQPYPADDLIQDLSPGQHLLLPGDCSCSSAAPRRLHRVGNFSGFLGNSFLHHLSHQSLIAILNTKQYDIRIFPYMEATYTYVIKKAKKKTIQKFLAEVSDSNFGASSPGTFR